MTDVKSAARDFERAYPVFLMYGRKPSIGTNRMKRISLPASRFAAILALGIVAASCQSPAKSDAQPTAVQPEEQPFFVGKWATDKSLCEKAAWTFTPGGFSTPAHVVCKFDRVRKSGIYDIDATCTAEGPPAQHHLKISYAQSAKALLVEGGPFQPVGLVACR